ncbi:MAG: isoprenylcysteine carboxylmethyltransferase family protein [Acidobacteria bacterium]|nr:isoprenylcysteine carboxylmethyltransferase family protein [Acidobacteriota bacterium]
MSWIRVARPASRSWNLVKTLMQTAFLWGTALAIVPYFIVRGERALELPGITAWPVVGWIVFAAASVLGLWSGFTMAWYGEGTPLPLDTARRFIIEGPYRWTRNPMAIAGLAQGLGVALVYGSWVLIVYVAAGGALWQWIARPVEEADLALRFSAAYEHYRANVPCWRFALRPYARITKNDQCPL